MALMLADLKWRVEQLAVSGAWCIARMHGKNSQESFTIAAGCFKDEETDLENYAKDLECEAGNCRALPASLTCRPFSLCARKRPGVQLSSELIRKGREQLAETAVLALYGDCELFTRQYTVDLVDQITRVLGLADAPEP